MTQPAANPPAARVLRTTDIDEQSALLEGWNQSYSQLMPGRFQGRLEDAAPGGAYLFREVTSQALLQSGDPGADAVAIGVPRFIGRGALFCGRRCDGRQLHLFSGREGFEFHTPAGLDIAGVRLSRAGLLAPLAEPERSRIAGRIARPGLLDVPQALRERLGTVLGDALGRLGAGAMTPGDTRAMLDEIAGLIRESLLASGAGAGDNDNDPPARLPGAEVIARLRAAVGAARPEDPTDIDSLCHAIGVSRRTLQYVFARELGMRPLAYVRALRLNAARRRIRGGLAVTEAATATGFWHFGRFAQDYRTLFGELPRDTLRRATAA